MTLEDKEKGLSHDRN